MLGIIGKTEADGDFDLRAEYQMPRLFTREVKQEIVITVPSNIPSTVSRELREKLTDALCEHSAIRLIPMVG